MVAIQYDSIGLINTHYHCDYTRAHAGHAMLYPAHASLLVVFRQLKYKNVFFTSAVSVHCQTLPGISFLCNEFRDTCPNSPGPKKSTVSHLVNRFRDTGSVQDTNHSSWPLVLSGNSLDDIHQIMLHSLWKSLRKLSLQSGLSYESVHNNRTCQEWVAWLFDHPVS
jgi:hypothetical protein